jgi:hypothetical protein
MVNNILMSGTCNYSHSHTSGVNSLAGYTQVRATISEDELKSGSTIGKAVPAGHAVEFREELPRNALMKF